jgi:hypothetical protein
VAWNSDDPLGEGVRWFVLVLKFLAVVGVVALVAYVAGVRW